MERWLEAPGRFGYVEIEQQQMDWMGSDMEQNCQLYLWKQPNKAKQPLSPLPHQNQIQETIIYWEKMPNLKLDYFSGNNLNIFSHLGSLE